MNSQPNEDPLCYWVLLTDSLHFCYTSPSFNAVVPQARSLIGRPFLDYLNPQANPPSESITRRLHNCYSDEEGNADVLYLNYATVSAIRFHLQTGHFFHPQPDYTFTQFAIVVSRAGGFILVFLHVKAAFSRDCNFHMCEPLKPDDLSGVAPYVPPLDSNPPYHVFQILLDDERRPIIFSTPTTLAGGIAIAPPVLAEGTQNSRDSVTNQGQTSCTKRTKLSFVATTLGGGLLNVSAVLLRHGNALLAMYKIIPYASSTSTASSPMQVRYNPPPGPPIPYQQSQQVHRHSEYRRISAAPDGYSQPNSVPQPGMPIHQPSYNPPYSPASSHHPRGSSYDSAYPPTSPDDARSSMVSSPRSPLSARSHRGRGIPMRRNSLTDQSAMSTAGQGSLSPQLGSLEEHKVMMHDSQRSGLHSPTESPFIMDRTHGSSSSVTDSNDLSVNSLRGRPAKEPPKGVTCCRSCQTTVTPEWRKGPTGNKDMCNACGLRWNRRLKKMKGDGANSSESPFTGLSMVHADAESLLEPQRAGGGSKKGHRKKAVESRGPALTTRPVKRRYSDAGGISEEALSSPHDDVRSEMPLDSYGGPRHTHPHNPHQSQVNASSSSRPSLAPLFDDSSNFSPAHHAPSNIQPQTPLTASSVSTSGASRMDYHQQRGAINHQMKSPSTPEVTHGYFPPPGHPPPADRKPFNAAYSRPPGSPHNGNRHYMNLEQAHHGLSQAERPSLEMQGVHGYHQNTDPRHAHSHSHPHFERHTTDPNLSNGASNHPGNSR